MRALELEPAARDEWLRSACEGEPELLRELASMLVASANSEKYFEKLSGRIGAARLIDRVTGTELGAGSMVGGYRLLREIGSGGMASVWLAERTDGLINRPVALKFPHGAWRMAGLAQRMAQEREILATLSHPNIARLYDAGVTTDGQPFLALEYVEGVPIDEYCRDRKLPPRERLQLFVQVARAVAHAHARLIVHRDLKPSNVLVTGAGEVRLLDFGIARLLAEGGESASRLTAISGRALTIDYASPEQILGQPISTASDIYSLGVLLFEMLTGQMPYRLSRESRGALEEAILTADAPRPSDVASPELRRSLRGDVDTIVLKALRKKPEERYATVDAFIDDIERHFGSRPVLARPDNRWYRLGRLVARNRVAVAAGVVVVVAVLGGTASALLQARATERERQRAQDINAFITSVLQRADPYHESGSKLSGAQLLLHARDDLAERFPEHPDRRIELLNVIGAGLIGLGELVEAEQTLRRAHAEAQAAFGGDDAYSLQARVLLAEVKSVRRDAAAAREALRELVPAARRHIERNPEILVRALKLESDVAIELGEFDRMRGPVREAVSVARAQLGRDHPLTDAVCALLAETYVLRTDDIDEMLRETDTALRDTLASHPDRPDHAQVLRMREIRSRALAVAGSFPEAVAEMRLIVEQLRRVLGGHTAESANLLTNLATYERRLGEFERSLTDSTEALRILDPLIEKKSADYSFPLVTRGVTLVMSRRPVQALEDLTLAQSNYHELFGPRHRDTLTPQMYRAVAFAYLGRFDEARNALASALDHDPEAPNPAWWEAHEAGIVYRLSGDNAAAIEAQKKALELISPGPRAPWEQVRV